MQVSIKKLAFAIRFIPPPHQLILSLIYYDNLTFGEVSCVLDLSVQEVHYKHLQAIQALYASVDCETPASH